MKKILSILIAVALLMTLTVSAFAADTETPVVTVSSATAEVGEEVTLEVSISATTLAGYGMKIIYDSEALEITSIQKGEAAGDGFFNGSKKTGKVTYATTYNEDVEGVLFTVTFNVLAEGQHTVSMEIDRFALEDQSLFEVSTVDGVISVGDVTPDPEPEVGEGEIVVETTDTYGYFDLYSMTAPATGTYTFYIPAGLGVWSYESYMSWGQPEIDFYDNTEGYELVKDLTEGEVFEFYVGATTKATWTITYTYTTAGEGGEGGEGGGEEGGIPEGAVDLTIGNNAINAADITFVYTAPEAGTLTLNLGNAIMGPVEGVVTVNFANEQALNVMGQIVLELAEGDVVLVAFTASGYATMTAEWTVDGGEEPGPGTDPEGNTLVLGSNDTNAEVEYTFTAEADGTLTIDASTGTFQFYGTNNFSGSYYNYGYLTLYVDGEAIDGANMGVATIEVTAGQVVTIMVGVNNTSYTDVCPVIKLSLTEAEPECEHEYVDGVCIYCGEEDPNYAPECEHEYVDGVCIKCGEEDPNYQPPTQEPDGTSGNPFIIEELPYSAEQTADQDLYYQWTATENGTLYVYYADGMVALSGSSLGSWEYADGGRQLAVAAGDVITINYWNGTGFTVEFVADSGEAAPGTQGNPIAIDTLNITLTAADSEIYYAWTATEAGEIVIRVAECTWGYGYSLTINGQNLYGEGAEMTINVEAGDQIIIMIQVYPSASSDGHLTLEQVVEEEHVCEHVVTDSKEATCTEDGYVTYTCECGDTYTETVPATGHNYVDGVCVNCGEADPDYVPECEHEYVDGVCTKCGEADPNYVPPTGSINILAVALIAAMSVTAVVVTAKKSDEE